jgi:tellurite resistance protein TehA-like permease
MIDLSNPLLQWYTPYIGILLIGISTGTVSSDDKKILIFGIFLGIIGFLLLIGVSITIQQYIDQFKPVSNASVVIGGI